ncbi:crossover junction endodeoxyribonuclease RuvC [Ehrlichia canis]|uniref:crossover junction endodeoxyribonuclease RuvC n=1 Tax=Ehrlichia canis TaxID=944 RepID=UPI000C826DE1|nr:crossover junction endodeoxyribonuclease RuvC [Ehrlichia canis]AUO54318.1 crossover junction endodeoxyribonuclease RuvC [Ehrlichia canis]UKC53689.1 ruvC [Ehrlichia canis]UKC54627.1 ruvC [Ehrlichia canis]UKC55563.1 ruvC [Ehrlichia canis]
MNVIGLDPGLNHTGWGILSIEKDIKLVGNGVIKTNNKETPGQRLNKIHKELINILNSYQINSASMEEVFINKNPRSSISLCYARGVLLLTLNTMNIQVFEYSSNYVKKSITGNGHAKKEQVHFMVEKILNVEFKGTYDISDAIAVALCHAYSKNNF